jgi:putative transposase
LALTTGRFRIYRALALQVRHLRKRHIRHIRGEHRPFATRANQGWSLDFLHDTILTRRWFRALNIMDDLTREQLALEIEFSFSSGQVILVLDAIAFERGMYPAVLRIDQGPELTSLAMLRWAAEHNVVLQFSDPGKPTQNAHVESLNGRVRDELFNLECYRNIGEAREAASAWRHDYNHVRPHSSLGNMTPVAFAENHDHATLQLTVA